MISPADELAMRIIMTELKDTLTQTSDLKARVMAAFRHAKDHWSTTNDDARFRGALAAVLVSSSEHERHVIEREMKALAQFEAFIRAAQQGLSCSPPEVEEGYEYIGLIGMWREVKA